MIVRAFAKVNLCLRVLGRRADGYHELETVFQSLELADELAIEEDAGLRLRVEGDAPPGEDNLVLRAARALAAEAGRAADARIELVKRIPMGGGLGGGSSDAAAALEGLDRLWKTCAAREDLVRLGASLGADVPYFLHGGTALGRERGDAIVTMDELEGRFAVLALPGVYLSTAEVFAAYDRGEEARREAAPLEARRRWAEVGFAGFGNDLEPAAFRLHPRLAALKRSLLGARAEHALLTGTGSTVYGLFHARDAAEAGASTLEASGTRARVTATIDRARYRAERFA